MFEFLSFKNRNLKRRAINAVAEHIGYPNPSSCRVDYYMKGNMGALYSASAPKLTDDGMTVVSVKFSLRRGGYPEGEGVVVVSFDQQLQNVGCETQGES